MSYVVFMCAKTNLILVVSFEKFSREEYRGDHTSIFQCLRCQPARLPVFDKRWSWWRVHSCRMKGTNINNGWWSRFKITRRVASTVLLLPSAHLQSARFALHISTVCVRTADCSVLIEDWEKKKESSYGERRMNEKKGGGAGVVQVNHLGLRLICWTASVMPSQDGQGLYTRNLGYVYPSY